MSDGVKIRTNDKEWQRLKGEMKEATKTRLLVGAVDGADKKHPNANATVGEVAIWNEFGTMTIPARSFARDWAALHTKRFAKDLASAHAVIILGRGDSERILGNLGKRYASSMKKRIEQGIRPLTPRQRWRRRTAKLPSSTPAPSSKPSRIRL